MITREEIWRAGMTGLLFWACAAAVNGSAGSELGIVGTYRWVLFFIAFSPLSRTVGMLCVLCLTYMLIRLIRSAQLVPVLR